MDAARSPTLPAQLRCPTCGGILSEPVSGAVHCYRKCGACGEEFQLDDPRLA